MLIVIAGLACPSILLTAVIGTCFEVGWFGHGSFHPTQVNPGGICTVFDQQAGNVERNQR
jgi:hypothetical protein